MDIEKELAQNRLAMINAIVAGRTEIAIRRLKAYVRFAEAYLDAANKHGLFFSYNDTDHISMEWRILKQIIDNAREGIITAVKTGNTDLILTAADLPLQFMKMSIEKMIFCFIERCHKYILGFSQHPIHYRILRIKRLWLIGHGDV
jgi:hypothetical protein